MTATDPVQLLLDKLPDAHRSGNGWVARCPAHEDRHESLSLTAGEDGKALLKCHAGCAVPAIAGALGLKMADLFVKSEQPSKRQQLGRTVATYEYQNADGDPVLRVTRHEPKTFRQHHREGTAWRPGLNGTPTLLYRLPLLLNSREDAPDDTEGDEEQPDEGERLLMTTLGDRDERGRLFLSKARTLPTAVAFVAERYTHELGRTLHVHAGTTWAWGQNHYAEIEDAAIRAELQPWMHDAMTYQKNRQGELEIVPFPANSATINSGLDAVKSYVHLPMQCSAPFWIGDDAPVDARQIIPCRSFNYCIRTGKRLPATPTLFNISALDFDPTADAATPVQWLRFLAELWPDDPEQIACLQEWFGYLLTCDTSLQKALLLVGPRRSGKGTLARILSCLVGHANRVGLTTSSLAGLFGLQQLIGKSVATIPDARFHGEGMATVIERLLTIIGEDALTIDRKHRESVTMMLAVRFVLLSNELPRFNDSSAALVGRFIILKLTRTFYGNEDPDLTAKLEQELPGIFLWAVDGLRRLRARRRFVQPAAGGELIEEMEDLASPVAAFVRERCEVAPELRAYCDDLYPLYREWCVKRGTAVPPTAPMFSRDLKSAFPQVCTRQNSVGRRFFGGLGIIGGAE